MAMDKNYGIFGIAIQADEDTPASAPSVSFPASAASAGIDSSTSTEGIKLTIGGRDTTVGRYKSDVDSTAQVTTLGFADLVAFLMYSALGDVETTGAEAPYTHKIRMVDGVLPPVTFSEQVGSTSASVQQMEGCKLSSMSINAEGIVPPSFEFNFSGTKVRWLESSTWSGPAFDAADGWFASAGAEVLFSLTDGNPGEPDSSIVLQSLNVGIENNLEKQTRLGSVDPVKQKEGSTDVTCALAGTTTDTTLYRQVMTGSENGTELAREIVTGSLQITFPHTKRDDLSLVIKIMSIPWAIEPMTVDPEGGEFELSLSTEGALAVDGSSIEVIVKNDVAKIDL